MDQLSEKNQKGKMISDTAMVGRRDFLKIGAAGVALGAIELSSTPRKVAATSLDTGLKKAVIKELDDVPYRITKSYKPFNQRYTVFNQAISGEHGPLAQLGRTFEREECDNNKPGFTRIDWALHEGVWALEHAVTPGSKFGRPNVGLYSWKQKTKEERENFLDLNYVNEDRYEFKSKKEAAAAIKRTARLCGADLVGITSRNTNWDYEKHFDPLTKEETTWDEFPFEPKSVIVLGFEMDYECIATAPTYTSEGAIGEGYSQMAKTAYQLSIFLKSLGYKAVAAGNDLGVSVAYAVQAGLGELGRNGILVNYKYGPRMRIAKVYTDLDFVKYDKPKVFGVHHFCENCKRCADACPAKAISQDEKPSLGPPQDVENWFSNPGVEKWYLNAKKCFEYWCDSNTSCATCITSCPYNKPDFWHHKLVDKLNAVMPGPVHTFMREMDILFGYGNTFDQKAVTNFWAARSGREYLGY